MDLVRALIGLPPYAVHLWHSAYIKIMAGFAFRCVHVCMFILYLIFVRGVRFALINLNNCSSAVCSYTVYILYYMLLSSGNLCSLARECCLKDKVLSCVYNMVR